MRFMNLPKILVNRIAIAQTHNKYKIERTKKLEHKKHLKRLLLKQA